MKRLWNQFSENFLKKEFLIFVLIGGINTLTAIAVSYLLSLCWNPNLSYEIGYVAGFFVSYFLNSRFTFHATLSWKRLLKFAISTIPNFLIQNAVVLIFLNGLGWHKLIVYVLAAAIGVPVTFLLQKFFTFGKKK